MTVWNLRAGKIARFALGYVQANWDDVKTMWAEGEEKERFTLAALDCLVTRLDEGQKLAQLVKANTLWDYCKDDSLLEEGEVRIFQGGDECPIALAANYAEAEAICNAVNTLRGGQRKGDVWDDNSVQFPRLLAEIHAAGLPEDVMETLTESMDLTPAAVTELLERADLAWEEIMNNKRKGW